MSENALHRDNPTRVFLAGTINYSHAAAPDFLQNFVMTKAPRCASHVRLCEDAFERFARPVAFGVIKLDANETGQAIPLRIQRTSARRASYERCWQCVHLQNLATRQHAKQLAQLFSYLRIGIHCAAHLGAQKFPITRTQSCNMAT